jgi:hypothetical protein
VSAPKPGGDRTYKRSWKNLLINKRYQLQFTLFMVGLSTLLMSGLGIWVMRVANETTTVSMASVRGTPCPKVPALTESADHAADSEAPPPVPMKLDDAAVAPPSAHAADEPPSGSAGSDSAGSDSAGSGSAGSGSADEPRRAQVQIDESSMTMMATEPKVPPDFAQKSVAHWTCELRLAGKIDDLERGRALILWVLIATGLLLVLGLAVYGIKMTHRVAGPLFKVSLYLAKMRDGRFDKVWNLRKGDQLVDFYEHFKTAHAGVVQMQQDDIAKIKQVIAAAEAAGAGEHATVVQLREMLERKEKAIE